MDRRCLPMCRWRIVREETVCRRHHRIHGRRGRRSRGRPRHDRHDLRPDRRCARSGRSRGHRHGDRIAGPQDHCHRQRRTVHRSVPDARLLCRARGAAGIQAGRSGRRAGAPGPGRRVAADHAGRRAHRIGAGGVLRADDRHDQHDDRRQPRQRHAVAPAGRTPFQRYALPRAGRELGRQRRRRQPVDRGIERPREPVRRGRREHHQRRVWRAGVVLDRVRLARQRHAVRLHAGSPGEDRRLRGGVRAGDRRRDQRRHQERFQYAEGQRVRLHPTPRPRVGLRHGAER